MKEGKEDKKNPTYLVERRLEASVSSVAVNDGAAVAAPNATAAAAVFVFPGEIIISARTQFSTSDTPVSDVSVVFDVFCFFMAGHRDISGP